jgi:hypothetical protein
VGGDCGMMFDKSTRTLMAMLMQRGMTEMSRTFNINGFDRHVSIQVYRADLWRDEDYYTATISGWEDPFTGSTLDEVLDQLQDYIDECEESYKRIKRRAV